MQSISGSKSHNAGTLMTALVNGVKDFSKKTVVNGTPVEKSGSISSTGNDFTVYFEDYVDRDSVQAIIDAHSA
tara:strand:+ start:9908 stop:10126 length:219 start_codon:yes stop_codon:yes gene_type:complete